MLSQRMNIFLMMKTEYDLNKSVMRKFCVLLYCAFTLVFVTSCDEHINFENESGSQEAIKMSPKIEELIYKARHGAVEAYDALAVCYRDGDGVEQSDFNMMTMYMLSCRKSGRNIEDVIKTLDVNNPLRLLIDVLDCPDIEQAPQEMVLKLRSLSLADALVYDAIYALECRNDTLASLQLFKEAVEKGSDMACILQIGLYERLGYEDKLEQSLYEYANRFPVLYVKLGELSAQHESERNLKQAVKFFTVADNYGMLTVRGARELLDVYRILEKDGRIKCDPQEIDRLEYLAKYE